MKKFTLLVASLFITIGAMAQQQYPFDGKKRMTADELNAVTEKTSILIRCTHSSQNKDFYNHKGRTGDTTQQYTYFWVPAVEGVAGTYHIMKGDGENDYMQATSPKDYGAKSTAATFHAVKPTNSVNTSDTGIVTDVFIENFYEDMATGGDYYVRIAFKDNSTWLNINTIVYNTGCGVWTVQNVYNMDVDEEVVEPAVNALATGKYYRFKPVDSNKYITAPRKADGEGDRGKPMILSETKSLDNILYYYQGSHSTVKNMLMVYGTGTYINGNNHANYDWRGSYFFEATEGGVLLRIEGDNNYWKENGASVTSTANKEEATVWEVEEITALPVSITEAGCATLYTPVALRVPDGVTAYYLSQGNITAEKAVLTEIESREIPAGNGVVIYGNRGEYNFEIIENAQAFEGTNVLAGTVNDEQITADAYVLFNDETHELGFYKAEKDSGGKFWILGHKAHLPASAVPAEAASSVGFRFDFTTTAIEEVKGENGAEAIYDLQGRRIDEITELGIYIVNGVKRVVR